MTNCRVSLKFDLKFHRFACYKGRIQPRILMGRPWMRIWHPDSKLVLEIRTQTLIMWQVIQKPIQIIPKISSGKEVLQTGTQLPQILSSGYWIKNWILDFIFELAISTRAPYLTQLEGSIPFFLLSLSSLCVAGRGSCSFYLTCKQGDVNWSQFQRPFPWPVLEC